MKPVVNIIAGKPKIKATIISRKNNKQTILDAVKFQAVGTVKITIGDKVVLEENIDITIIKTWADLQNNDIPLEKIFVDLRVDYEKTLELYYTMYENLKKIVEKVEEIDFFIEHEKDC